MESNQGPSDDTRLTNGFPLGQTRGANRSPNNNNILYSSQQEIKAVINFLCRIIFKRRDELEIKLRRGDTSFHIISNYLITIMRDRIYHEFEFNSCFVGDEDQELWHQTIVCAGLELTAA